MTDEKTYQRRIEQLEQELSEHIERLRCFLSLSREAFGCIEFDVPISTELPHAQQASCMLAGQLVDCNDEFARIYNVSYADDLVGARFVSLIITEETFLARARRFVKLGYRLVNEEIENIQSNGSRQFLIANVMGDVSEGALRRMWVVYQDVSLRRLVEQAMQGGQQDLDRMANHLDFAFWMMDWKNFNILYIGSAFEELWKHSKQELLDDPLSWLKAVHPSDRQRVRGAFLEQAAKGTYDETYRIVLPDGRIRMIRDRAFPIPDHRGEIDKMVGLTTDVSAQTEARTGLNHFFDHANEMIVVIDGDGSFRQANPAFCSFVGYEPSELIGTPVLELIHPDDRGRSIETVSQLKSGIAAVDFNTRFLCKDQQYREMEWNIAPLAPTGVMYATTQPVAAASPRQSSLPLLDALTPRERQIMNLVVEGQPNKAIARRLGISQRTVEKHRSRVMSKLNVDNVPDLVRIALLAETEMDTACH